MSKGSATISSLAWSILIVGIVGSIVAAGWWLQRDAILPATQMPSTTPATVVLGKDYYFFVRLVEFKATTSENKKWDSGDTSAPDAEIVLHWRGNRTFSWADRNDQLINTWDMFRVDIKDLITNKGKIDLAAVVNGPLLQVVTGEAVTIEIWDEDPMFSDLALKMEINLAELREGRNIIKPPSDSGIARLEIDMIDRNTPLARLIELQTNGG